MSSSNVKGVYAHLDSLLTGIGRLRKAGVTDFTVISPLPRHEIEEAIYDGQPSPVRWWTLTGGLIGSTGGFLLETLTAAQWPMTLPGGKPIVSMPPFFVIIFECTVLLGGLCTLLGLIFHCRLPAFNLDIEVCDPRYSLDKFGLVVHGLSPEKMGEVSQILSLAGAEEVTAGVEESHG